mmetsp:Transcript_4363/g.11436  ORF Transcript_4363/g.11436 Transcript_4363/m.11436 type:complete len:145 (+) Transcript_4363:1764-2198(+)
MRTPPVLVCTNARAHLPERMPGEVREDQINVAVANRHHVAKMGDGSPAMNDHHRRDHEADQEDIELTASNGTAMSEVKMDGMANNNMATNVRHHAGPFNQIAVDEADRQLAMLSTMRSCPAQNHCNSHQRKWSGTRARLSAAIP